MSREPGTGIWDHRAAPPGLARSLAVTAAVALLGFVALSTTLVGRSTPTLLDRVARTVAGDRSVALAIDALGDPLGACLLGAVLVTALVLARRARAALLAVLAETALWTGSAVLKPVIGSTIHGDALSYPSGHTAGLAGFAIAGALAVADSGRAASVALAIALVACAGLAAAWAQLSLDAHYATDTVGGLLLALAVVPALALLLDRVAARFGHAAPGAP